MDIMQCPHCGGKAERPVCFTNAEQRIFDYVLNHPGCTRTQISQALYAKDQDGLGNQIASVRSKLAGTNWSLASFRSTEKFQPQKYYVKTKLTSHEVADAPTEFNPSLPSANGLHGRSHGRREGREG